MKNMNENTNVTTKGTPSLNMITPITTSIPSTTSTAQTINPFQLFNNPEFGDLRCIEKDGEPWFVGKDVATALGYSKPTDAVRKRVFEEDRGVSKMETPSGTQQMTIINESGLYSLIFGSKLEKAKRFKHWVTSEVLPALRKTGSYTISQGQNGQSKPMSREYLLATAFLESQKVIEENTREIARLSVKCNNLNDQVSQDQEVIDAMTKDVTPAEKRAVLNRLMTYKHGAVAGSRWSILYREFEEKYHFNLDIRMKNYNKNPDNKKCKSKVDYVDRVLGMLDELYALAVKLFRSDYDALIEQTYHVRKTDEQIQNELMLDEIPDEVFERSNN
jgi:prophage antirepressor-like protein